jgi:hypothetical protein
MALAQGLPLPASEPCSAVALRWQSQPAIVGTPSMICTQPSSAASTAPCGATIMSTPWRSQTVVTRPSLPQHDRFHPPFQPPHSLHRRNHCKPLNRSRQQLRALSPPRPCDGLDTTRCVGFSPPHSHCNTHSRRHGAARRRHAHSRHSTARPAPPSVGTYPVSYPCRSQRLRQPTSMHPAVQTSSDSSSSYVSSTPQ